MADERRADDDTDTTTPQGQPSAAEPEPLGRVNARGEALTYGPRIAQYRRRENHTTWMGAGLAGLIALTIGDVSGQLLDDAPGCLVATMATLIVLAGGALAFARTSYEWAATVLQRQIDQEGVKENASLPSDHQWPQFADGVYFAALFFLPAAAIVYLVAMWWAVS